MALQIKNKIIETPLYEILQQVKRELKNGKLAEIRDKGQNLLITCPKHSDGKEKHAACQIYSGDASPPLYGQAHCFVCGYKADFSQLISDCFDAKDRTFGEDWLIERYGFIADSNIIQINSPIDLNPATQKYLDPAILNKYAYKHPYMYQRKLTDEIIEKFHIGYDNLTSCITFPVWDENNNLVMITKRSVKDKTFFIERNKQKPVYLYNFIKNTSITTVFVCESQINALTLWSWGYPAVALFGTGSKNQYDILKRSGIRSFILCFDGDDAGDKGIERFKSNMPRDIIIVCKQIPRKRDVNDLSRQEFDDLPIKEV